MSAAITAAEAGASVLVLEKDASIGGNARWAEGFDLESRTFDGMRSNNAEGDPLLQRLLVDSFEDALTWLCERGVELIETKPGRFDYRQGQGPGGIAAFSKLRTALERAGGELAFERPLVRLVSDERGAVVGAAARGPGGDVEVRSAAVVLATGGFGNNVELKARYFGPAGAATRTYGSDHHDGDGLIAALAVGAAVSNGISVPTGGLVHPPPFEPPAGLFHLAVNGTPTSEPVPRNVQNFLLRPPAAWTTEPAILVNLRGDRYVDESLRYTLNGWKTTLQPLGIGFCIFDGPVHERHRAAHELALAHGAVIYRAETVEGLVAELRDWRATDSYHDGVNPARLLATIAEYNRAVAAGRGADLHPRRRDLGVPISTPPYHAIPVVQAIVDTAGCLQIDGDARVLDRARSPIPGLFATGADGGRPYTVEHGGLSNGLITGRRAGELAAQRAAAMR
jgi:succinate dehydrogenase/fumarate reductase flavoprotein subunit